MDLIRFPIYSDWFWLLLLKETEPNELLPEVDPPIFEHEVKIEDIMFIGNFSLSISPCLINF